MTFIYKCKYNSFPEEQYKSTGSKQLECFKYLTYRTNTFFRFFFLESRTSRTFSYQRLVSIARHCPLTFPAGDWVRISITSMKWVLISHKSSSHSIIIIEILIILRKSVASRLRLIREYTFYNFVSNLQFVYSNVAQSCDAPQT